MPRTLVGATEMRGHFFIVGSGRCGSKLLRKMLRSHPDINICIETHFLPVLHDLYGLERIAFDQYFSVIDEHYDSKGSRWIRILLESEGRSYDGFRERFAEFCGELRLGSIVDYTDRLHEFLYGDANHWVGDKTPHYGVIMTTLRKMWPEAKFIHLVRDGVYASQSMTGHPGFVKVITENTPLTDLDRCSYKGRIAGFSSDAIDIEAAAQLWQNIVLKIHQEAKALPNDDYCEVKYEDLIRNPKQSLRMLAQFLRVEPYRNWLRKASFLPNPLLLSRRKWRLSKREYDRVADGIQDGLALYGYPVNGSYYNTIHSSDLLRIVTHSGQSVVRNAKKLASKVLRRRRVR